MKNFYILLIASAAIIYSSCSKKNNPKPDALQGISLRDTLTMYLGDAVQLDINTNPASYDTTKFTWKSADTSIVSISATGKLTAKKEGVSKITLSNAANTKTANCTITVKDVLKFGLLASYPFDNSAADVSGNGNNGEASNIVAVPNRFGEANSAVYFNGYNSLIKVNDNASLRLAHTSFAINAWVKMDEYNYSYGSQIIDKKLPGEANGWNLSITGQNFHNTGQGALGVIALTEGSADYRNFSTIPVGLNGWHMITVVYDYNLHQLSFYMDGVFNTSSVGFASPNSAVSTDVYIGADNPFAGSDGYFLKGAMDDLRVYDRALNASDVRRLYTVKH
jgi:hypothetical protein